MSNSLDPDQARHFVGPDLGSNCLQRLSADNASRRRVNHACTVIKWDTKPFFVQIWLERLSGGLSES